MIKLLENVLEHEQPAAKVLAHVNRGWENDVSSGRGLPLSSGKSR